MSGLDDDNLRADLNALLDGALSVDRAAELHALIESDAAVRAEYESLRRADRGLNRRALGRSCAANLGSARWRFADRRAFCGHGRRSAEGA